MASGAVFGALPGLPVLPIRGRGHRGHIPGRQGGVGLPPKVPEGTKNAPTGATKSDTEGAAPSGTAMSSIMSIAILI